MDVYTGMVLAGLIFLASLISVELGISAAIIEIVLGVVAGNFLGIQQLEWVKYIASFGGILLTFLAGASAGNHQPGAVLGFGCRGSCECRIPNLPCAAVFSSAPSARITWGRG